MESQKGGSDMGSTGEVCVCEGGGVQGRGGGGGWGGACGEQGVGEVGGRDTWNNDHNMQVEMQAMWDMVLG
jgi:hypothetical protein